MVKKIAIYHSLPFGGALNMVLKFAEMLGAHTHIDLFCMRLGTESRSHPHVNNCKNLGVFDINLLLGAPNLIKNIFPLIDIARLYRLSRRIASEIDAGDYDVILVFACRFFQTPIVLKYLKTPTLYYCTEPFRFFYEPMFAPGRKVSSTKRLIFALLKPGHLLIKRLERSLCKQASIVFTHSEFTREQISTVYGVNALLCPLGISEIFSKTVIVKQRNQTVLSVGAVVWKKGHEFAVRAVGCIDLSVRPKLKIIGHWAEQAEPAYLRWLANDLGVNLELCIGVVENEELVNEYRRALVVLCMAYNEPFGLTPLESLACGTPVVAIREGGYKETIVDNVNGFLVPRDPRKIASAITTLIDCPELAGAFGVAGQKYVYEKWLGKSTLDRLTELLEHASLVKRKGL